MKTVLVMSPPLHGSEPAGLWAWTWEPTVLIGLALISAAYLYAVGPLRRRWMYGPPVPGRRVASFLGGNLVVFLALVTPLDHLSDQVLFSAHMLQHLLLLGFAPVLWLVGLPDGLLDWMVRPGWARKAAREITRPIPAFLVFNAVLLLWHVPALYNTALENEALHAFEHLTFMAAAVIGWWPVFGRFPEAAPRASLGVQLFYLFLMMFPSTALAAWITLTPTILYPFYGFAPLAFRLTPQDDQQLAGLLMWIPGNGLFFLVFSYVFFLWFQRSTREVESETLPAAPETVNPRQEW